MDKQKSMTAIKSKSKKKTVKQKKTKAELISARNLKFMQSNISKLFNDLHFDALKLNSKESEIQLSRLVELDHVFLYENIIIICEDTAQTEHLKDHMRKKQDSAEAILFQRHKFIDHLRNLRPNVFSKYIKYNDHKYIIKYLYFSFHPTDVSDAEKNEIFNKLQIVEKNTFTYLCKMADTIKISFRHEFFKFLELEPDSIGMPEHGDDDKRFRSSVIYPDAYSGMTGGFKIISFIASANFLLQNGYVLRKDSWTKSDGLMYQRLLEKPKVNALRKFIVNNKETFFNNIIIGLPDEITLMGDKGQIVDFENMDKVKVFELMVPNKFNTLCIIDGQHRIFAYYEGDDIYEEEMAKLRKELHLLVTGIIFPKGYPEHKKRQFESKVFLDINYNAKKIPAEILNHIQAEKFPFLDTSIARKVLLKMNERGVFRDLFEFSTVQKSVIKVASIIKFALNQVVKTNDPSDKSTLFYYFSDDLKAKLNNEDNEALTQYISFCSDKLKTFFSAVKQVYQEAWDNKKTKILSVVSINGFILTYKDTLRTFGVKDRGFYVDALNRFKIDFSKDGFKYQSSGYNKFSEEIYEVAFKPLEIQQE